MRARLVVCSILVSFSLAPSLLIALVAITKGHYLQSSHPAFWRGAHAGERNAVSLPADQRALDAITMLRQADVSEYAMTDEFKRDPILHQRTIEIAWPIRPVLESRYLLSVNSEQIPNCTLVAKADRVTLCVRQ